MRDAAGDGGGGVIFGVNESGRVTSGNNRSSTNSRKPPPQQQRRWDSSGLPSSVLYEPPLVSPSPIISDIVSRDTYTDSRGGSGLVTLEAVFSEAPRASPGAAFINRTAAGASTATAAVTATARQLQQGSTRQQRDVPSSVTSVGLGATSGVTSVAWLVGGGRDAAAVVANGMSTASTFSSGAVDMSLDSTVVAEEYSQQERQSHPQRPHEQSPLSPPALPPSVPFAAVTPRSRSDRYLSLSSGRPSTPPVRSSNSSTSSPPRFNGGNTQAEINGAFQAASTPIVAPSNPVSAAYPLDTTAEEAVPVSPSDSTAYATPHSPALQQHTTMTSPADWTPAGASSSQQRQQHQQQRRRQSLLRTLLSQGPLPIPTGPVYTSITKTLTIT